MNWLNWLRLARFSDVKACKRAGRAVPRAGGAVALLVGLLLGGWLSTSVSAQPFTSQVQRALAAFLTAPHTFTGTQTFTNLTVTGTCTGCGGGGTPGGSTTQVQFNDATAFGGDAALTFNKTTKLLTVAAPTGTPHTILQVGAGGTNYMVAVNSTNLMQVLSNTLGVSASDDGGANTSVFGALAVTALATHPSANGLLDDVHAIGVTTNNTSTGTVTDASGISIDGILNAGMGTITNAYGIKIGNQTAATNNYAIYTGTGAVRFGDAETIALSALGAGPATAPNQAISLVNTTAATSGTTAQWSPGHLFTSSGWDTDDAVARTMNCYFTLRPVTGNTVVSQLQLMCNTAAAPTAYTNILAITNTGQTTSAGAVVAGVSSSVGWNGRSVILSPVDGIITVNNNANTIGAKLKVDALPTVASGFGVSPAVTAQSTALAGSINVGTGGVATSGVIDFNGAAFSTAPFCLADSTTSNITTRTSSTTTQLTLTTTVAWSSGDVLNWMCIGPRN